MKELSLWCKNAKKALIDRDMSVSELADAINKSRSHTSVVLNGSKYSQEMVSLISDELNISDEGYFKFKGE